MLHCNEIKLKKTVTRYFDIRISENGYQEECTLYFAQYRPVMSCFCESYSFLAYIALYADTGLLILYRNVTVFCKTVWCHNQEDTTLQS
jgi:hypothetical protein